MSVPTDEPTTWRPIATAAPRLGLSLHGLKSRIRRGALPTRRDNRGRLLVAIPMSAPTTVLTDAPMSTPTDQLNGHDEVEHWRAIAEAAKAAAARAEGELAGLRVALELVCGERDRLRRGWLERLLEAVRRR